VTCSCTHIALCHQYRASTAANDGECLAPQCPCGGYESGESALGIRGNDVSAWDNRSSTKDGPGDSLLAQRVEVPGPRPTLQRSAEL
jgi:hypothetical protein